MWPEEEPFQTSRHDILRAVRTVLGRDARHYNFNAYADQRAVFRYDMHTLPTEIAASIGTSTLFAAWNAATYVAQIDDERLAEVLGARKYLEATREVLQAHGRLWFLDESYVISRKRETDDDPPDGSCHSRLSILPPPAHPRSPALQPSLSPAARSRWAPTRRRTRTALPTCCRRARPSTSITCRAGAWPIPCPR